MAFCQLDQEETISMKYYLKFESFHSRKCISKYCLRNGGHFISASMYYVNILILSLNPVLVKLLYVSKRGRTKPEITSAAMDACDTILLEGFSGFQTGSSESGLLGSLIKMDSGLGNLYTSRLPGKRNLFVWKYLQSTVNKYPKSEEHCVTIMSN